MITPKQFLESFFQEKASVYSAANLHLAPVYEKYFGGPLSKRASGFMLGNKETEFDEVKQSADSATAITRQHFRTADLRTRYHLASFGETWKIVGIDRECFTCRATGQAGGSQCQMCAGEGWIDYGKNS